MEKSFAFAAALLLILPVFAAAACANLDVAIAGQSQSVVQGETAVYTLALSNKGVITQDITAGAQCPTGLTCEFSGISYPTLLVPSGTMTAQFYVYTNGAETKSYTIPIEITANEAGQSCTADTGALSLEVKPQNATAPLAPITATLNPTETQVILPGNFVQYTLTLTNNYGKKIYATIADEGNPFKDSTKYSYSLVSLEAGETKSVDITVNVPPATPGMTYDWTITIKSSPGNFADVAIPVSLQVYAKTLSVSLLSAPYPFDCTDVMTGDSATIPLTLRNDGEVTGPFSLGLEGSQSALAMASLDRKLIEMKGGEQADVAVKVSVPFSATLDNYVVTLVGKYGKYEFLRRALCFNVKGFENLEITKPRTSTVARPSTAAIPFTVKNTGTIAEEIAFEWTPGSAVGFVNIEPDTFNLTAGQSLKANLVISTTMDTPLQDYIVPVKLIARKSNYSMALNFNISVVSSNRSGESLLQVIVPKLDAVEEGSSEYSIPILNLGSKRFDKVVLAFEGISKSWASVDFPRAIAANGSAEYLFTIAAPKGSAGTYAVTLYAVSGRESVRQDAVLTIKPYLDTLGFTVTGATEKKDGSKTSEVTVVLRVQNNGAQVVNNVAPALFADDVQDYNYEAEPQRLILNPGDYADVKFTIRPNRQTDAKGLPVMLSSNEGKTAPQTVSVPAMTAEATAISTPFPLKTTLVIILLVVIFALMAYEPKRSRA